MGKQQPESVLKKIILQRQLPFWLLTFSVLILLVLPSLLMDGMFMDGVQYAIISRNLAHGTGSFWEPFLSNTWDKNGCHAFLEHPPLVYGIQSLFFQILGDSRFTERFYSFLTALLTAWILIKTWNLFFYKNDKFRKLGWLPVLFWIIIPVCSWSYQNNMQENTMGIFTATSVYFTLKACILRGKTYLSLPVAGVSVFLATLCKGIPGLFPVVVAAIYWLVYRNFSFGRMLSFTLILLVVPALLYLLILQNPAAFKSMHFWLFERVLARMQNEPTSGNRFDVIWRVFTELLPSIILTSLVLLISRFKKQPVLNEQIKSAWLFFGIGLAGSLPMLVSLVQKGFYLVPAFPFFALSLSILSANALSSWIENMSSSGRSFRIFKLSAIFFLAASLAFSFTRLRQFSRDENTLVNVCEIGQLVPKGSTIEIEKEIYTDWSFQFYLLRYFDISVTASDTGSRFYLSKSIPYSQTRGTQLILLPRDGFRLQIRN